MNKPQENVRCCDCQNLTVVNFAPICEAPRPWWAARREGQFSGMTVTDILTSHPCDCFSRRPANA